MKTNPYPPDTLEADRWDAWRAVEFSLEEAWWGRLILRLFRKE